MGGVKLAITPIKMKFFEINDVSITILQIGNFYAKWWKNHSDFSFGKIVFANRRFVWYAQLYKLEIAYEQFRNK